MVVLAGGAEQGRNVHPRGAAAVVGEGVWGRPSAVGGREVELPGRLVHHPAPWPNQRGGPDFHGSRSAVAASGRRARGSSGVLMLQPSSLPPVTRSSFIILCSILFEGYHRLMCRALCTQRSLTIVHFVNECARGCSSPSSSSNGGIPGVLTVLESPNCELRGSVFFS